MPGEPWALFSHDVFDPEAAPSEDERGEGLRRGVERLWRRVLEEAVQDDGRPTFTDFSLRLRERTLRLPRDPLQNPALARLRGWRRTPALLPTLGAVTCDALALEPVPVMVSLAREAPSAAAFIDQLGPLRFVLPLARALTAAFELPVHLAQVQWQGPAVVRYGAPGARLRCEALGYAPGGSYDGGFAAFRVALDGCVVAGRALAFAVRLEDTDSNGWYSRLEFDAADERAARLARALEQAPR